MNQILALKNPWKVDMPLKKLTKENINSFFLSLDFKAC